MTIKEIAERRRKERELTKTLQEIAGYEVEKKNEKAKKVLLISGAIVAATLVGVTAILLCRKKKQ